MPSLRRTLSSPSVRSSPYSYSSSPSSSLLTRQGSHGPRRSSGSDTTQRRVLVDIDWWRVEEGQRELRGLPPLARPTDANHENANADAEHVEHETGSPLSASVMTDFPLWEPDGRHHGNIIFSHGPLVALLTKGSAPLLAFVVKKCPGPRV